MLFNPSCSLAVCPSLRIPQHMNDNCSEWGITFAKSSGLMFATFRAFFSVLFIKAGELSPARHLDKLLVCLSYCTCPASFPCV